MKVLMVIINKDLPSKSVAEAVLGETYCPWPGHTAALTKKTVERSGD